MTLSIVDVAFQSIRLMIVGAQLMTVDAWTPACAVDQFYKKAGSKKPQSVKVGVFIFSPSSKRVRVFSYRLTILLIADKVGISKPGLRDERLQELARSQRFSGSRSTPQYVGVPIFFCRNFDHKLNPKISYSSLDRKRPFC
jgi:hypothetical protein